MAKFRFNLREPEATSETPIHLIVRWEKNKLVYPTGESINPKNWQGDKDKSGYQREKVVNKRSKKVDIAENTEANVSELNTMLDYIQETAKTTFRRYVNDHNKQQPTLKVYRELLNLAFNKSATIKHDLISFAQSFADTSTIKKKPVSEGTKIGYNQTITHLKAFKEANRIRTEFDNIDEDFYNEFVEYLTDVKKFSPNNIGKHIKHLKVFINAIKSVNPDIKINVANFTGIKIDTDSIYLNHTELTELYNLDLSDNTRLEKVRDLFILGAYSGLRFSDFSRINAENIVGNRIKIVTQKTKQPVSIPFHSTVKSLIEKYDGAFPEISNAKMNEYLKEVGELTELLKAEVKVSQTKGTVTTTKKIKKYDLLTTHTARRSFATNAYLDGVPSLTIMAITGHKTEKSFLRYIKVTPDEHATILENLWNKSANNTNLKIA